MASVLRAVVLLAVAAGSSAERQSYIVQLREPGTLEYGGGVDGFAATRPRGGKLRRDAEHVKRYAQRLREQQDAVAAAAGVRQREHSYTHVANGFAAQLDEEEVERLRGNGAVLAVERAARMRPVTDSTPQYLGLSGRGGAWMQGYTGDGVVIGVVDTGIEPEHPSFADVPTARGGPWDERPAAYEPVDAESFNGTGCAFGTRRSTRRTRRSSATTSS